MDPQKKASKRKRESEIETKVKKRPKISSSSSSSSSSSNHQTTSPSKSHLKRKANKVKDSPLPTKKPRYSSPPPSTPSFPSPLSLPNCKKLKVSEGQLFLGLLSLPFLILFFPKFLHKKLHECADKGHVKKMEVLLAENTPINEKLNGKVPSFLFPSSLIFSHSLSPFFFSFLFFFFFQDGFDKGCYERSC